VIFYQNMANLHNRYISAERKISQKKPDFNLLLRNHWTNCNQTLVEWSLDGPLSKMCPVIPTSNQDGRQAKNRKKGGNVIFYQNMANLHNRYISAERKISQKKPE
jgi:RNase P subunit RPR2